MQLYGSSQAGGVLTGLWPGDALTVFDGTETAAAGLTSLAFVRCAGPSQYPFNVGFQIIGVAAGSVVKIQASDVDTEADYQDVWISTGPLALDIYTDYSPWKFYRAKLSSYTSGAMPQILVQR